MLKTIRDEVISFITSRVFVLMLVFFMLSAVLIHRLFDLQIVKGEEYLNNFRLIIRKEKTLDSTRGKIFDRNGELLAYNELAYSVMIEDVYESGRNKNAKLNATISELIDLIEAGGDKIVSDFSIIVDGNNEFAFTEEGTRLQRFLADVYGKQRIEELDYAQKTATPEQVIDYLASSKKFGIGEYMDPDNRKSGFIVGSGYTKEKLLKIVTVRYAMSLNSFQKYIATTVATDVSERTVAMVMENSDRLEGVTVAEDTIRKYVDSVYFSHLIGYIGKISTDEYEQLSEENGGYVLTDLVGKAGIEQYMETTLQGKKGKEIIYVDNLGKVIETSQRTEPTTGNDVYLTIDKNLQKAVYHLLEQKIAGILISKLQPIKEFELGENESSSHIQIPIYDVYFALFNNSVIDLSHFTHEGAKETERKVFSAFHNKQERTIERLRSEMMTQNTPYDQLDLEYQVYQLAIVQMLEDNHLILTDQIDEEDETYLAWKRDENISLKTFLNYLISKEWLDVTKLELDEKYSNSDEVYGKLVDTVCEMLLQNEYFNKRLYKYMLLDDEITGEDVCELLIEQNLINVTDEEKSQLHSGERTPYAFMVEKIRKLEITPGQLALDPCSGSCVITDPNNGEVLACVTYPGYDNNRLTNSIDSEYYNKIYYDLSQPMWNYATQQLSAPGSTFKMISSAAVLEEGTVTVGEEITCHGVWDTITPPAKCWISPGAHGPLSITGAIEHSCNYYFFESAYRMSLKNGVYDSEYGLEKLAHYADMFGLSDKSGIELPESSPKISDYDAIRSAIGQGTHNYSTVGLARYVSTVANNGNCFNLSMIDKVTDTDGNLLEEYTPTLRNHVELKQETWNALHAGMRKVVEDKEYYNELPIAVAGKTGTAQENKRRANHALFVCYAPYDAPKIAMATRIAYGYASDYAAQVSEDIIKYYFKVEKEEDLINGRARETAAVQNAGD
ncbi:MAG: penicillin-binding protein [Lachnospiraceae bacterium]|nr:penicillin-binding protein [Lachnospiraceae bacterium]